MARTLFPIHLKTDGTSTTGTFTIESPLFTNTPEYLRFDKGLKVKIWSKRASGKPVRVYIQFTNDVTESSPSWVTIDHIDLPIEGEHDLEKRRPTKIDIRTGKEAIRFTWDQTDTGAGESHIMLDIEVTDEVEDSD